MPSHVQYHRCLCSFNNVLLQYGRDDIAVMLQSKVETLCAADSDSKKRGRSDMDVEPTRPHSRDRISSSVQSQNRQRI